MKTAFAALLLPLITTAALAQDAGLRDLTQTYSALAAQARAAHAQALAAAVRQADWNRANQLLNEMVVSIMAANGITPAKPAPARIQENDEFQAYSMADGSIVVFTGLLDRAQDDNELAFVLGHEIAHWTLHHAYYARIDYQMIERARWYYYLHGESVSSQQMADTRQMESEADRQGMIYAAKAGYDLAGVRELFDDAFRFHRPNPRHPSPQSRYADLQRFLGVDASLPRSSTPVRNLSEIQKLVK